MFVGKAFFGKKRGQGAFEYVLLIGGVLLIVILSVI
ncbi:class III signal peptide-containing protein, partial [Candidatus Micrarchaeota archaeon]|nr:class III signal peptide-containing protein [Candidatus Micrarchaeota archaeon]